jgi:hypothetical protein
VLAAACIIKPTRISILSIIAAPIAILALILYGALRDYPVDDWGRILYSGEFLVTFKPSNLEFGAYGKIAEDVLGKAPVDDFPTFAKAFVSALPRVLAPLRPEGFGEWFSRTYYPEYWAIGGGYASNLAIESLLNWGVLGPAILGGLLGLFVTALTLIGGPTRIGQGVAVFSFVFVMRFDMVTLLKTTSLLALMVAGWVAICFEGARQPRST